MLGEFSLPKKKQDSFEQKLKKIREIIDKVDETDEKSKINPSDRSRIKNQIAMLKLMSDSRNNKTSNIRNIVD